jgi:hypothetical protein
VRLAGYNIVVGDPEVLKRTTVTVKMVTVRFWPQRVFRAVREEKTEYLSVVMEADGMMVVHPKVLDELRRKSEAERTQVRSDPAQSLAPVLDDLTALVAGHGDRSRHREFRGGGEGWAFQLGLADGQHGSATTGPDLRLTSDSLARAKRAIAALGPPDLGGARSLFDPLRLRLTAEDFWPYEHRAAGSVEGDRGKKTGSK